MDRSAARTRVQQQPRKPSAPLPGAAQGPPPVTRLLPLVHIALTCALAVAVVVGGALAVSGKLRLGGHAVVGDPTKPAEQGGRFRIEPSDDMRTLFGQAGGLGFLGDNTEEVWVFKYRGGFLECSLEAETFGNAPGRGSVMPDNWPRVLSTVAADLPDTTREGYIVVAAMRPIISIGEALESHYPHLGGFFVAGPAGPLHQLTTAHVDSSHWRFYRILLVSGPPEGQRGERHNLWAAHQVNVRLPMIPRHFATEDTSIGGGKDLEAGKEITLLDRQRGFTRVRLKARFLTDAEAKDFASRPAAK